MRKEDVTFCYVTVIADVTCVSWFLYIYIPTQFDLSMSNFVMQIGGLLFGLLT